MTHRQIFRHPVGRMPGPARWYLAALAMLSLLLAAAHFAVQAQAQRAMRTAVERLLAHHGGSVASVRYHLLRGALNLRDIRIRQGPITLHIARAALHASTRAITSSSPTVTNVKLDGATLALPATVLVSWLTGGKGIPEVWTNALMRADVVHLRHGVLRTTGSAEDGSDSWAMRDIGGEIRPRAFRLVARAASGRLAVNGARNNDDWKGEARLQRLPATWLARTLALNGAPGGILNGALTWRVTSKGAMLAGDLRLPAQAGATLHLDAHINKKGVTARLAARHWPLDGWATAWPALFGRAPAAGVWNGEMEFARAGGAWRLRIPHGEVRDLVLAGENLPDWRLDAVDIEGAVVDWQGQQGQLARARIRGASLQLLASVAIRPGSPWRWQIGRLDMEDIRPELLWRRDDDADASDQRLALPPMHGRLRMASNGHVEWQAESADEEGWTVEGKGRPEKLSIRIAARQASLARLRPLLPHLTLVGEQGPVRMLGAARLDLRLRQMPDRWTMEGNAELSDVELAQGGDAFRAGAIVIPLEHVDIPLTQTSKKEEQPQANATMLRKLGDVRIRHWLYQAALHPIPRALETSPIPDAWPTGLDAAWQIGSVVFENGRISVGNADATWVEDAWMRIGRLEPGKRAALSMRARIGGGTFSAKGWLEAHARPQEQGLRLRLRARLGDALPFFLNDWLAASGAPRLIRGRLNAALDIRPQRQRGWSGKLTLTLRHGAPEGGAFPDDPLATLTGFDLQTLLMRLGAEREITLRLRLSGNWQDKPPSLAMLGRALATRMKARAEAKADAGNNHARRRVILAGMRLYRGRIFTHNERVRLRKVIRSLRKQPKLIVELVPRLGAHEPDVDTTARVRRTQSRIERYMRARGVASRRIYPVWPTMEHRGGDTTGVDIVAVQP